MKNGHVTLALSSGQQITARMEGKVPLTEGQSMFFQVKSNDGTQIAIRPFLMDGTGGNYALMKALSAAGLPAEPNYLSMVNRMMEEQMSIDRLSLQQMARTVNLNSEIDVQTIVQLKKLGIPVTVENASQFENYLDDKQAITKEMDAFINELPKAMAGENLSAGQQRQMSSEVLSIITEGLPDVPQEAESYSGESDFADYEALLSSDEAGVTAGDGAAASGADAAENNAEAAENGAAASGAEAAENSAAAGAEVAENGPEAAGAAAAENGASATESAEAAENGASAAESAEAAENGAAASEGAATAGAATAENGAAAQDTGVATPATPHTLAAVLTPEQLQNFNQLLGGVVGTDQTGYLPESGTVAVLRDLQQILADSLPVEHEKLSKLLSSDEFQSLVKDSLQQQWTIRPRDLEGSDQINRLYERLENQVDRIENAMKAAGQQSTEFNQLAADIRGNVEFMNQINEAYTYAQIPLKMSGQNASGELYVYTNKKALVEGKHDLTAFLHLDMDNLGPTDVSVRMQGSEVSTNFYLDSDAAFELVERNVPVLEERLRKKGYNCQVSVINESKHVNFVEDFLKKDMPSAGQLHRYSFDMRA
jgi:hypothetical protein